MTVTERECAIRNCVAAFDYRADVVPLLVCYKRAKFAARMSAAVDLVWFIEIDRGTEPSATRRRTPTTCAECWQTGIEQHRHRVLRRTMWNAPDTTRAQLIADVIDSTPDVEPGLCAVGEFKA